jgi:hypothetical protein
LKEDAVLADQDFPVSALGLHRVKKIFDFLKKGIAFGFKPWYYI